METISSIYADLAAWLCVIQVKLLIQLGLREDWKVKPAIIPSAFLSEFFTIVGFPYKVFTGSLRCFEPQRVRKCHPR